MALWKVFLGWAALIAYRLITAIVLIQHDEVRTFGTQINTEFWLGYTVIWIYCLFPKNEPDKEQSGFGWALFNLAWVFLVAISGLGIKVVFWALLRERYGLKVLFIWGEVFTVIYCTLCLFIPVWLSKHSIARQGKI